MPNNLFYAQSGGTTAVINASACGVIETARHHKDTIGTVLAGQNGILGALNEALYDTSHEPSATIAALRHTPGGAFGSCRFRLKEPTKAPDQFQRLFDVFGAHQIRYFLYNGGGDSQDTAHKVQQWATESGYPLTVVGIPKTVDNDLAGTDCCPGFGSVAKYIALSVREAALDVASMCATSTKVFVLEVMGRHTGWIASAGGLAESSATGIPPVLILFPERPFNPEAFFQAVTDRVRTHGYCTVVVSEGLKDAGGRFLSDAGTTDAFGHAQLGGVAPMVVGLIKNKLGLKCHWAVADYLQRSARHIASKLDVEQAYAVGQAAVEFALAGEGGIMATIIREAGDPEYRWSIGKIPLSDVANIEKPLPEDYISADGLSITAKARTYLTPLIQGESLPPYKNGLPDYVTLNNQLTPKKLPDFTSNRARA